jgi:hypothetical protein
MAEELLVGEQLTPEMVKSGEALVAALDKMNVLVKGAFWLLLPDQRVWRLVIASPEVRVLGPKALYRKLRAALGRLPADVGAIGTKDISVIDEKTPLFLLLRSAVSTGPGIGGVRFSRSVINGQLIEDAYLYRLT